MAGYSLNGTHTHTRSRLALPATLRTPAPQGSLPARFASLPHPSACSSLARHLSSCDVFPPLCACVSALWCWTVSMKAQSPHGPLSTDTAPPTTPHIHFTNHPLTLVRSLAISLP